MSNREKPLPKPQRMAFGRKKRVEHEEEQEPLLADRMAAAAAEGKLDAFLESEMPDSAQARNLARMMLGMTGMMPVGEHPDPRSRGKTEQSASSESGAGERTPTEDLPEEVLNAARGADVKGLVDLLRREHQKRTPGADTVPGNDAPTTKRTDQPEIGKDIIDELMRIASDNGVTIDWIILRAIKLYVEEHHKTGKL